MRLHVTAKRYLVTMDPAYAAQLGAASRLSLARQGGPMPVAEADAFRALPHAAAAIAVRRLDDRAKDPAMIAPDVTHFLRAFRHCLQQSNAGS